MNWPDFYLLCFAVGALWTLARVLLGGLHFGHGGHMPGHAHSGMSHSHAGGTHSHAGQGRMGGKGVGGGESWAGSWFHSMINPSCAAIFLAWFGGVGYLLTRHSGLAFWADLSLAIALGL